MSSLAETLYHAWRRAQPGEECKVCSSRPNEDGERIHGKGCYQLSENGGGSDWPDDVLPDFANLESEQRAAWERVAEVARDQCHPAIVGYRCACGIDHTFETREVVVERLTKERDEARTSARFASDMLREIPSAALTADKVRREDWPELFDDDDGAALYLETAVERVLAIAKEKP